MTKSCLRQTLDEKNGFPEQTAPVVDWIDRELGNAYVSLKGRGGDTLLELRRIFSDQDPKRIWRSFCKILPRLEEHHYLLGYRIRRWLNSQWQVLLTDPLHRTVGKRFPLPLNKASLQGMKREFFENAEVLLNPAQFRVKIVPAQAIPDHLDH